MATPNGTESPNLRREELDTRFNSILLLANGRALGRGPSTPRVIQVLRFALRAFQVGSRAVGHHHGGKEAHKGGRDKVIVDRAVNERMVEPEVMLGLLANKGELKLFLKRSIAAMGGVSLDRQPAYDAETSLLLKDLIARLRPTDKAAEAACTDSTDSDSQVEL
ncbi:hypothetical protein Landi51_01883 [Colletotrichum acutatum]